MSNIAKITVVQEDSNGKAQLRPSEPVPAITKPTQKPPPHGSTEGVYLEAWNNFCELDEDDSGSLDKDELLALVKKCRIKGVTKKTIGKAMAVMDPFNTGVVSFDAFAGWWNGMKEAERREMRRAVKDAFDAVDVDGNGRLEKTEFAMVAKKAGKSLGITPPFDLESDWAAIAKTMNPSIGVEEATYHNFEVWWKERLGIVDADIPVLPEYMVQKIDEAVYFSRKQTAKEQGGSSPSPSESEKSGGMRSARDLWGSLRPRLLSVVRMQRQWGPLHEIYDSNSSSRFEMAPLPRWIRNPDSNFSAVWDLAQVALLLYVAITVPLRAGFDLEVELASFSFFVDMLIDIYFITDICLNFRTAYFTKDGNREERGKQIARHYIRGWFAIDLFSTLPLSYATYFVDKPMKEGSQGGEVEATGGGDASNFRAMKAMRLVRLSKMLRLARIKKILSKYGDNVNFQMHISIGFTIFTIFFMVHILTCFFYMAGASEQMMDNGKVYMGWVQLEEGKVWHPVHPVSDCPVPLSGDGACIVKEHDHGWDELVGLSTRYVTSVVKVLNALENVQKDAEKSFAIFAEFIRDFILGMVAGLMTTISMAMNGGDQEAQWKLRALKGWMQRNNLPKTFQIRISEYCNELWSNRSGLDEQQLMNDVPPSMRVIIKQFLYSNTVAQIPLFRGLSDEVVGAICNVVQPMHALRGEYIMEEGKPGRELYMILKGELEVFKRDDRNIEQRLGFLSEGSFFGESAVLSDSSGKEVRSRTLKAVTDSELCFLTRESLLKLRREYPELEARLKRFVNVGPLRLTRKGVMEKIFSHEILSNPTDGRPADARQQLQSLTADFEDMRQAIKSTEENGSPSPTATMLKRTTSRAALKLRSAMLLMKTEGGRSLASSKSAPPGVLPEGAFMDLEEVNELVGEGGGISLAPSPPAPAPAPAAASFARPSGTLGTQSEIDELRSQTERLQQTVDHLARDQSIAMSKIMKKLDSILN